MLVQLNAQRSEEQDAIALLLECHQRIRHFCTLAVQLSLSPAANAELIRDTAQRVHRYFSVALPLHLEDEDHSIRPRLEPVGSELVTAALHKMALEHERCDTLLIELLPTWVELQRDPSRLGEYGEWLQSATKSFHAMMSQHLELEEVAIFPMARRLLRPEALIEIAAEMRARRQEP